LRGGRKLQRDFPGNKAKPTLITAKESAPVPLSPNAEARVTVAAAKFNNRSRFIPMFWVLRLDPAGSVVVCCARSQFALSRPVGRSRTVADCYRKLRI
jgi:hypothetical protein